MKLYELQIFESLVDLAEDQRPQLADKAKKILKQYRSRAEYNQRRKKNQNGLKDHLMDILNSDGASRTVSELMQDYKKAKGREAKYQSVYQALTLLKDDGLVKHNQFIHPAKWKSNVTLKRDTYSRKLRFSQENGFKSVADAIAAMGVSIFNEQFRKQDGVGVES